MSARQALEHVAAVVAALTGRTERIAVDLGKLEALQGVKEFPSRVKCATLAWHALNAAIDNKMGPATTE